MTDDDRLFDVDTDNTGPACGDVAGTVAGARRHQRARQPLCEPCRAAWNERSRKAMADRRKAAS